MHPHSMWRMERRARAEAEEASLILMVRRDGRKLKLLEEKAVGSLEMIVDSGAEIHVIPRGRVPIGLARAFMVERLDMRGAGGARLEHLGRVQVRLRVTKITLEVTFEVVDVQRTILSVAQMRKGGWEVTLGETPYIRKAR